ncbi:MAG TPA: multicopper oxidase family protein [Gemmatimonadaceae bacterium]|nr:multicopper oxidase family protein [Gemmatimonadaceae bacterium]
MARRLGSVAMSFGHGSVCSTTARRDDATAARGRRRALLVPALLASTLPLLTFAARAAFSAADPRPTLAPAMPPAAHPLVRRVGARRVVELTLTAAPTRLALLPGRPTTVYAYDGQVPGPTLELREGDSVVVHFRNALPEPSTIHWHGIHLPFVADGSPFHPVSPGGRHDYVFVIPPGTAGTYWYHPHPHHLTAGQVARGLYGAMVVRAADDPLPATLPERLLVLSDNRFRADGSVDLPDPHSPEGRIDAENGREGDVLFVNGQVRPTFTIRSGEVQRWRVVNTSAARVYRLAIPGHVLLHVGSDGGLFERPREVEEIVLGVGERVELLVRGSAAPGTRAALRALPYDRYIPQTRPADWETPRDLLTLQYTDEPPVSPPALPRVLRPVPALDTTAATATRVMVLTQHLINGRSMDMDRVDVSAPLGGTEIWEVENLVGMDHPFHLHGFRFQVLDRNGVPEPYRSWKDVVNVPKHETARFIVRYDDHPGRWMFHCHILDHEDHGMMGVLEVRPPVAH